MNQSTSNNYDSEFCGNLPIHLINVVQPYGALVVVDRQTGAILQASENIDQVIGVSAADAVKTYANTYVATDNILKDKANLPQLITVGAKQFLGIYHEYPSYYILEINLDSEETAVAASFINVFHGLKEAIAAVEESTSLRSVLQIAANELKRASGFDKVMIYRFDENWNGQVLAEEKEPNFESYLGLTFPASDIPRQARELYLKNAYRFIPDRSYKPVKLFPVINPATNRFLDMADCNLRGVSSVHLEYLKNMGVEASMSTRIIKDGKLWGLIACHHATAMKMSYKVCTEFELLSGIISAKIGRLESQEQHDFNSERSEIYSSLVNEAYRSSSFVDTLLNEKFNVLQLFNAEGAVVSHNGNTSRLGSVPESSDIEDLILWLNSKMSENIYYTNSLSNDYDYASEFRDVASGMMAIPVDVSRDEYILLFRSEAVQFINWGGDPGERINFEADMKTYHPRFSFKIWQEKVTGTSIPWQKAEVEMAENLKEFAKAFLNGKDYTYRN